MTEPTEQEIEHVARAMCEADGEDADRMIHPDSGEPYQRWADFADEARRFLAGYHAMQERR